MDERIDDPTWLDEVVDDLTKYNIVRFLYEHPTFRGDVQVLQHALGLQHGRRVAEAAEQLAADGVLVSGDTQESESTVSPAIADSRRAIIGAMLALPDDSPEFASLMRRLTAQTIRRAVQRFLPEVAG